MRIDDYMATCLLHPTMGYYTTRDPFGQAGDFVTAPEISQMFGEVLGLCLAQYWFLQGAPEKFTLAELGPGRGTLMSDMLRATKSVTGFHDAAQITLIEASPALQAVQREALEPYEVTWASDVSTLPNQPLYLIANEFFDALPIRQFVRSGAGWRERQIGAEADEFTFGLGPEAPQPALSQRYDDDAQDGDLVEDCPSAAPIISEISRRVASFGGGALIIDYGDWRSLGDTLQAVRDHKMSDPLAEPGQSDLTAHVDFEACALAAAPCAYSRLTPQGVFLERLGITPRAQSLAKKLTGDALGQHIAAHRRLTHPEEMGNLFKVLGLYPSHLQPPPGLEP